MRTMGRDQQRAVDRDAAELAGIPTLLLMEQAATSVAKHCRQLVENTNVPIDIITGKGNNGGDGYALARLLRADGYEVRIFETCAPSDFPEVGDSAINRQAVFGLNIPVYPAEVYRAQPGLIVDCVYGTGFKCGRPLAPALVKLFSEIEQAREKYQAKVVAVDVPSGVDGNTGLVAEGAIRATHTVTFIYPKPGLLSYPGRANAGHILIEDIGIPADFVDRVYRGLVDAGPKVIDQSDVRSWCPKRADEGHKGTFGHALLCAGSRGFAGAGILSCRSALVSGCGLVTWLVPEDLYPGISTASPAALIRPRPVDTHDLILDFKEQCMIREAVLIGPGCGVNQETGLLLEQSLRHAQRVVVDADALTVLADSEDLQAELSARTVRKLEPAILTPHPGEFYRLYPEAKSFPEGRIKAARDLADRWHAVIVLKGAGTIVAIPECIQAERSTWINTTGNHGLARGGSGDVLAGLMTGLLAQQLPLTEAVCGAVYLHGLAGDLMSEAVGARAMDIANLPDYIGMAFRVNEW